MIPLAIFAIQCNIPQLRWEWFDTVNPFPWYSCWMICLITLTPHVPECLKSAGFIAIGFLSEKMRNFCSQAFRSMLPVGKYTLIRT